MVHSNSLSNSLIENAHSSKFQNLWFCGHLNSESIFIFTHFSTQEMSGGGWAKNFFGVPFEFPESESKQVLRRTAGAQRDNLHVRQTDMRTAIYEYMHIRTKLSLEVAKSKNLKNQAYNE